MASLLTFHFSLHAPRFTLHASRFTLPLPSLPLGGAGGGFYFIYVSNILHPSSGTTFRLLVVAGSSTVMP